MDSYDYRKTNQQQKRLIPDELITDEIQMNIKDKNIDSIY